MKKKEEKNNWIEVLKQAIRMGCIATAPITLLVFFLFVTSLFADIAIPNHTIYLITIILCFCSANIAVREVMRL